MKRKLNDLIWKLDVVPLPIEDFQKVARLGNVIENDLSIRLQQQTVARKRKENIVTRLGRTVRDAF